MQQYGNEDQIKSNIPVGSICFTKDDLRVVYANDQVWRMLGVDESDEATKNRIANSAERLIPLIDQYAFAQALQKVELGNPPVEIDTRLWHINGYLIETSGWLSCVEAEGSLLYKLSLIDVTRKQSQAREGRRALRIKYLKTLYDVLFLFETSEQSARRLQFCGNDSLAQANQMRFLLPDAVDYLAKNLAQPGSQADLRDFLLPLQQGKDAAFSTEGKAHRRISFEGVEAENELPRTREAILIDAEGGGFFFCSRVIHETDDNETAKVSTALSAIQSEAIIVALSLPNGSWRIAYANEPARALFRLDEDQQQFKGKDLMARSPFPIEVLAQVRRKGSADIRNTRTGLWYRFFVDRDPQNSALRVLRIYPLEMMLTHSELEKKN